MWDHGKNPIIESAADKHGHITIKEMNKDANERPEPNKLPIKELIGQSMIDVSHLQFGRSSHGISADAGVIVGWIDEAGKDSNPGERCMFRCKSFR